LNKKDHGFETVKPTQMIEELIFQASNDNSTILDFFVGSGTTAQSVLEANVDYGGKRKFIVCTNNENNICRDITYQRLKTVITGKRKDKSKYSDGLPGSLKYFRIDYVPISEKVYYEYADELLLHIRELVELENGINLNNNTEIAIILTDEEMAEFVKNKEKNLDVKKVYYGHNVLLSGAQAAFMKERNIKLNVIPDYYYQELEK
jgi:adenine-specific DNA-methyltransferase